jgi:Zn-dependent M28 family amino/carboxypeptidase
VQARSLSSPLLLIVIALVTSILAFPQEATKPQALATQVVSQLEQIRGAALASDYGYQALAHLTDNIGPRPSGSAQGAAAVEYVAAEMKKLGLQVKLEPVTVPHWVRGAETAELVSWPGMTQGTTQKIVVTALGLSVPTPAQGMTAEVVVVNSFAELEAMPRDKVAGKIVVFNHPLDKRMAEAGFSFDAYSDAVEYRSGGAPAAGKKGGVAALVRSVGSADYRLPHTGGSGAVKDDARIPAGALAAEDADLLERLYKQGPVRLHLTMTPQKLPDAQTSNVLADIRGSEHPEEVVIISGHLDSWDLGTGAIDDGAGVAVSMEAAHIIQSLGLKPKRTIRVVAWAAEENCLCGGIAYGKAHKNEAAQHFAAIETDSGAGHPMGIYYDGGKEVSDALKQVSDVLAASGASIVKTTDETGADIIPLDVLGVPTFSPIQDTRSYFNYHHTAADTLDKVDPKDLRENAAVVAVLAYALANMDVTLPRTPKPLPDWLK